MTVLRRSFAFLSLLATLAAPGATQARGKQSPRPETPAIQVPTRALSSVIRVGPVKTEIGREDEEGPYMFANIEQPILGPDGTIYIAEYGLGQIRAFDANGVHIGTFGRRGRGPGEFVNPLGLYHDGDSTLFASQQGFGVSELTARGGWIQYRRTFGVAEGYGSLCVLSGRLFASVGSDSAIVVELDDDRKPKRRFGAPFIRSDTAAVRKLGNQGGPSLLCDERSGAIYAIRTDLGEIRRYDIEGRLAWSSTLPSFQHSIFGASRGGAFVVWSIDYIGTFLPMGTSRLLVQVGRRDFNRVATRSRAPGAMLNPETVRLTAYMMDAATGRIVSKSPGVGEWIRLSDTLIAERVNDPYPMARIRAVRPVVP